MSAVLRHVQASAPRGDQCQPAPSAMRPYNLSAISLALVQGCPYSELGKLLVAIHLVTSLNCSPGTKWNLRRTGGVRSRPPQRLENEKRRDSAPGIASAGKWQAVIDAQCPIQVRHRSPRVDRERARTLSGASSTEYPIPRTVRMGFGSPWPLRAFRIRLM
jgi:hypothetical protein